MLQFVEIYLSFKISIINIINIITWSHACNYSHHTEWVEIQWHIANYMIATVSLWVSSLTERFTDRPWHHERMNYRFKLQYHSIITSYLHMWTCVVPRQKLAWTTFSRNMEYTWLVCSTHVTHVDIPHAIYTHEFSTQCTHADMHVYLWHHYFMFVLPVVITH